MDLFKNSRISRRTTKKTLWGMVILLVFWSSSWLLNHFSFIETRQAGSRSLTQITPRLQQSSENGPPLQELRLNVSLVPMGELKNLFTCNYVRDGRFSRPGEIGASRNSWYLPQLWWKDDGKISYSPDCYRQVLVWSRQIEMTTGESSCPGLPCGIRLVKNTNLITVENSDAVIFDHLTSWDWDTMYKIRPKDQKWIYFSGESQINSHRRAMPPLTRNSRTYDYTMTYRHNGSLLYGEYGRYDTGAPSARAYEVKNWAAGKTKKVAWLASNCRPGIWPRTDFVKKLAERISVNIYGGCGNTSMCRENRNSGICMDELRQHKFYLALENSRCREYISEKLWDNAYLNDLIPIVYGPPREDYEAVAPPNSFIHVEDFATIKELASYLHKLDENDDMYNEYFKWKKHGFIVGTRMEWLFEPRQMCQVVERLLVDEEAMAQGKFKPPPKIDWQNWWLGACKGLQTRLPIDVE